MSAKPETERQEEIALNIADQEQLAALIIRVVGLDDDPIRALQIKTPMALRAWDAAAQILNSALPPLPQQGAIAQRESGGDEPVAWTMSFDEVEDLHSRISGVIRAKEQYTVDEEARWERLRDCRASLAQWLEAQRPDLKYAGGTWGATASTSLASGNEEVAAQVEGEGSREASNSSSQAGKAEPVAWTGSGSLAYIKGSAWKEGYIWGESQPSHPIALYTAPPPAEAQARVEALEAELRVALSAYAGIIDLGGKLDLLGSNLELVESAHARVTALLSGSTPKPAEVDLTEEMVEAAAWFVKHRTSIMSDIQSAHSGRGQGASSEMRADDSEFRADLRSAFDRLTATLSGDA